MKQMTLTFQEIDLIGQISSFTTSSPVSHQGGVISWCVKHNCGHYHIDMDTNDKEVKLIDFDADDKTYFALTAASIMAEYKCEDYYTHTPHHHDEESKSE